MGLPIWQFLSLMKKPAGDPAKPAAETRKRLVYMSAMARRDLMASIQTGYLDLIMSKARILAANYAAAAQDRHANHKIREDLQKTLEEEKGNFVDCLLYRHILAIIDDHISEEKKLRAEVAVQGYYCADKHFW